MEYVWVIQGRLRNEGDGWDVYGVYTTEAAAQADVDKWNYQDQEDGIGTDYRVLRMDLRS